MKRLALAASLLVAAGCTPPDSDIAVSGEPERVVVRAQSFDMNGVWPTPATAPGATTTTTSTVPPTTTTAPVTTAPPTTTPQVQSPPAGSGGTLGDPYYIPTWYALRECEAPDWAGGWQANTGNGFYGGLQFTLSSWQWVGGTGYPHEHSPEEQIRRGQRLWELQGWGAWPACSRKLGWR